ncbi:MAG: helix-turn-helix domain-containing protein [Paenibacillaceae bacterium]|nr:helix-turn-helix domain-containing protein [Paenibacillaceae bacterium]
MKFRASSFLSKLIGFALLLCTFPVIALGVFSYAKSTAAVQEKVKESNRQLLLQTQAQIEQQLRLVDYSAIQYMNLPLVTATLREQLNGAMSADVTKVKDLLESMSKLQSYELGTMHMELASLASLWRIDDNGLGAVDPVRQERYAIWVKDPRTSFWSAGTGDVKLIKKISAYAADPTGLLNVSIPLYDINKLIQKDSTLGHVWVADEYGYVFAGNDGSAFGKRFDELALGAKPSGEDEPQGFYTVRSGRDRVGVTYSRSLYNGWLYVSVVSLDKLNQQSQDIGWLTLYICLGIWAVALLLAYFGSNTMYRPIRKLYEAVRNSPGSPETPNAPGPAAAAPARNELDFIGEQYRGLLQNESRLVREMQGQSQQMKEYFVFKLFQSETAANEMRDKLAMFAYPLDWNAMCVMTVQIDTLADTRFQERDRDLLLFAVNNIVTELIPPELRLPPVVMGDSQVTLFGETDDDPHAFKKRLDDLAGQVMAMIGRYLQLKISIGFSRTFADFKMIRVAYGEALEALKYRMRLGEQSILFFEEVQPEQGVAQPYPAALESELLDAWKLADPEEAARLLHALVAAIAADERTYEHYLISFVRLLTRMLQAVKEAGVQPGKLFADEQTLFLQLFQLRTAQEVERWMLDTVMTPFLTYVEQRREQQYRSISDTIIQMIETGFDTELTLDDCARRMNYSPNYLTKVFRKETGVTFSDYLATHRLKMAKMWLVETDMKVAEIAEKLKYNTPANFIRYFRKMEGTTPGQYREQYWSK